MELLDVIKTERLTLRPWRDADAPSLYKYASDPRVGPAAGWPAHSSVEDSLEAIRGVLSAEETYAVCLKGAEHEPVGSIGLMVGGDSRLGIPSDEAEIGYWIGAPFWGNGYIPEACRALIAYGFSELDLDRIWCACYDGNDKSRRVIEKCGFAYHHTVDSAPCPLMGETRVEHVYCLDRLALDTSPHGLSSEARAKAIKVWDAADAAAWFLPDLLWL